MTSLDEILNHEVVGPELIGLPLEIQALFNKTMSEDPNQEILLESVLIEAEKIENLKEGRKRRR